MAESRSRQGARSPAGTWHRPPHAPGRLSKASSLVAPEVKHLLGLQTLPHGITQALGICIQFVSSGRLCTVCTQALSKSCLQPFSMLAFGGLGKPLPLVSTCELHDISDVMLTAAPCVAGCCARTGHLSQRVRDRFVGQVYGKCTAAAHKSPRAAPLCTDCRRSRPTSLGGTAGTCHC